jgi:hypothetical protein
LFQKIPPRCPAFPWYKGIELAMVISGSEFVFTRSDLKNLIVV